MTGGSTRQNRAGEKVARWFEGVAKEKDAFDLERIDLLEWKLPLFDAPASLKNVLDTVYSAWNAKPVAFVSYGGVSGGIRAVQQLRQVVVELQMANVHDEVNIPFVARAFGEDGAPADPAITKRAHALIDQLAWWAEALKEARGRRPLPTGMPPRPPR